MQRMKRFPMQRVIRDEEILKAVAKGTNEEVGGYRPAKAAERGL